MQFKQKPNLNKERIYPPDNVIKFFRKDLESTSSIRKVQEYSRGLVGCIGSARTKPSEADYEFACELFYRLGKEGYGAITGGGPGIMEAANLGALNANSPSVGVQPFFLATTEPCRLEGKMQYIVHSMQSRKISIYAHSSAIVFFPGGLGTLDELFEMLVLKQIGKMNGIPIFLAGNENYWKGFIKWMQTLCLQGFVSAKDVALLKFAKTPAKIVELVKLHAKKVSHDLSILSEQFRKDMLKCFDNMGKILSPLVSFFGSSKVKDGSRDYSSASDLSKRLALEGFAICSGGGNGIMEAVSKGAAEAGNLSVGLIPLFFYQKEKPDPSLSKLVTLNMLATRKLVLGSSDILVFYPGGYGTFDEIFEFTTRIHIKDMQHVPIIAVGGSFWKEMYEWFERYPIEMGLADKSQLAIIKRAKNSKHAYNIIMEQMGS